MRLDNPDFNVFVHPDEATSEQLELMNEQARAAGFTLTPSIGDSIGFYLDGLTEQQADTLSARLCELGIHAQVGVTY